MAKTLVQPALAARLLTIEELARFLSVSRAQAYLLVREDGFPLIELGPRLLRVDPSRLQRWLDDKAAA